MATMHCRRGYVYVNGKGPEGRVERQISKKRYGADYKTIAESLYKELLAFELTGHVPEMVKVVPRKLTFRDIAEGYDTDHLSQTKADNSSYVKTLILNWGDYEVSPTCGITREMFRKWILRAFTEPIQTPSGRIVYAATSIRKLIDYGRATYNWAKDQGLISYENPFRGIFTDHLSKTFRRNTKRKDFVISNEEFWEFIDHEDTEEIFKKPATVLWCTGMRRAEVTSIRWDMVHGDYIHFDTDETKETYEKDVFLEKEAIEIINTLQETKTGKYVFLNKRGKRLTEKTFSAWWHAHMLNYIEKTKKTELKPLTPHKLRDSYRTRKDEEGVDNAVIMAQMGHHSEKMSNHYNIVNKERQRKIINVEIVGSTENKEILKAVIIELLSMGNSVSTIQGYIRTLFVEWKKSKLQTEHKFHFFQRIRYWHRKKLPSPFCSPLNWLRLFRNGHFWKAKRKQTS